MSDEKPKKQGEEHMIEVLKQALEKINKASEKVAALSDGRERWTMSVPVRPDYDHDVVISGALSVAEDAIKQALAEREWVGLTDFDRAKLKAEHSRLKPVYYDERNNINLVADIVEKDALINAIEAKLKEKNT